MTCGERHSSVEWWRPCWYVDRYQRNHYGTVEWYLTLHVPLCKLAWNFPPNLSNSQSLKETPKICPNWCWLLVFGESQTLSAAGPFQEQMKCLRVVHLCMHGRHVLIILNQLFPLRHAGNPSDCGKCFWSIYLQFLTAHSVHSHSGDL